MPQSSLAPKSNRLVTLSEFTQEPGIPPLKFVPSNRSPISGQFKDKRQRIVETIDAFRLGIDGLGSRQGQSSNFQQSFASFAHLSSVFLRKMVVGDQNRPSTRLLDPEMCESIELTFDRLVKIGADRNSLNIDLKIDGGEFTLTKLNDQTLKPEFGYIIPIRPQRFNILVEWPLPGTVSWIHQPTSANPWKINDSELFDEHRGTTLDCDAWLGQQLVMFDDTGISLKEVIRRTTNLEGAHAVNPQQSKASKRGKGSNLQQDRKIDILSSIKIAGLSYNHIVIVETALCLYRKLAQNKKIEHGIENIEIPLFNLVFNCSDDVLTSYGEWLTFAGTMDISLSGGLEFSHRIRATK